MNQKAQRLMVERYSDVLYNLCMRYVRDETLAKDCLQESWIQIFWNLDKYEERGKWESWIKMVTINKCKEILRRENKWEVQELSPTFALKSENREEVLIEEESLNQYLDCLPQKYRLVVNMYLVEEYSHKEIAAFLEIKESSSRSILARALKMLRARFLEPENDNSDSPREVRIIRKNIFKQAII